MNLHHLQIALESKLEEIEKILGPNYKLTLIASHNGANELKDADLLLTMVDRDTVMKTVDRFLPQGAAVSEPPSSTPPESERQWYPANHFERFTKPVTGTSCTICHGFAIEVEADRERPCPACYPGPRAAIKPPPLPLL